MFEFKDITLYGYGDTIEYYWYDLLNPSRWNIRDDDYVRLAIL